MTDRKSKAAGEPDNFDDPPIVNPAAHLPQPQEKRLTPAIPEKLSKGRTVQCQRCQNEKPYFAPCPHCPAFNQKICICGHPAGDHGHWIGRHSGRTLWPCHGCLARPDQSKIGDLCCTLHITHDQ